MTGKRDLKQKVAAFFELPGDVMLDVARISMVGDSEVLVENHRSIVEYTQVRVVLGTPSGNLAIGGENLEIRSISPDGVIVVGKIREVCYVD